MAKTTLIIVVVVAAAALATAETLFSPAQSTSFTMSNQLSGGFALAYEDGSSASGVRSRDKVSIAGVSADTEFLATTTHSGTFSGDGVLGLGLWDTSNKQSFEPLLYALSDTAHTEAPLGTRAFTLALTATGGALYLGGYDRGVMETEPVYSAMATQCTSSSCTNPHYNLVIEKVTFGTNSQTSVLYSNQGLTGTLVARLDSGTSNIVLPTAGSSSGNANLYSLFEQATTMYRPQDEPYFTFMIAGMSYIVPYSDYAIGRVGSLAVDTYSADPSLFVLGDPFFRSVVVTHDLSSASKIQIGLAMRNRSAAISNFQRRRDVDGGEFIAVELQRVSGTDVGSRRRSSGNTPVTTPDQNVYMASLSVGTPAQGPFSLQLDTGSPYMVLFSEKPPMTTALIVIYVLVSVMGFGLVLGCVVAGVRYYRKPVTSVEPLLRSENEADNADDRAYVNVWSERDTRMVL